MNELSIEEKAKRYDEAIKKVNDYYEGKTKLYSDVDKTLNYLFPELKESYDERYKSAIRKMYSFLPNKPKYIGDVSVEDIFAWLEKQGEKKPTWSEEDKIMLQYAIEHFERQKRNCIDGSDRKKSMQEFIDWLKLLKERVQPQQEWSEEDEQLYNDLSDTYFYNDEDYPEETYKLMLKRVLDWMTKRAKSLRPNYWKPSEEQMKALQEAIIEMGKSVSPCSIEEFHEIQSLYCNLKKLTE